MRIEEYRVQSRLFFLTGRQEDLIVRSRPIYGQQKNQELEVL